MRDHSDQPEDQQSLMETHRNQDHLTYQTSRRHLAGADHLRLFFRVRLVEHLVAEKATELVEEKATELVEEKATELVEDRLGEPALGWYALPYLDCRHLSFLGHLDAVPYLDHLEADQ